MSAAAETYSCLLCGQTTPLPHVCPAFAAVTPLGEGGDESPESRGETWRCMAKRSHGLRCCVLNDADDETCGACGNDRPRVVSLPPQRSDETRLMLPITCNGCDAKMGEYDALTEIGGIRYCEKCAAGARSDETPTPNLGVTGSSVGVGARSGAGAEEAWQDRADVWRALGLEPSTGTADEAIAAIITLRAQLAEARKDTTRLDLLEAWTKGDQGICPPGNHGGDTAKWLYYREDESRADRYGPWSPEWQGITLRAAIALAAVHPTEENRA